MAHTPGPWRVATCKANEHEWSDVLADNGVHVMGLTTNQNLIAAAPDLLEALRNIIQIGKLDLSNPKYDGYFDAATSAIAKAEGH